MAKKKASVEVRRKFRSVPACWKKGTRLRSPEHRSQKYEVLVGRAKGKSICWACATDRERDAIKAVGGGAKDA